MRTGEAQTFPDEVHEQRSRLHLLLHRLAVDAESNEGTAHGCAPLARSAAWRTARLVRTRTTSRLYSVEPRRSAEGSHSAAAARPAASSTSSLGFCPRSACSAFFARI